jgi:outer membrane protein TolC
VQLAEAAMTGAKARVSLAHSLRYPLLTANVSESNLTRNLGAEGFNFPTGVPTFKIPSEVGPFNVFDGRVQLDQTVFDLSAVRRARAIGAAFEAASADAAAARESAAARAADDYLSVLASDAKARCAQASLEQAERSLNSARRDVDTGNASDSELNRARLDVSANKRKVSTAQNAAAQARLQLQNDLGLEFDTPMELTDALGVGSGGSVDVASEIAVALRTRAELRVASGREEEARDESEAVHAGMLPKVTVFGDVGPQNSVITHTIGISARITVFDGGRRRAEEAESAAAVRQYGIQQHDLKRQIELEVRRACATLEAASSEAGEADAAMKIAEEESARAQRRFANGVGNSSEVVNAAMGEIRAREERVDAALALQRARLELAKATGTVESFDVTH